MPHLRIMALLVIIAAVLVTSSTARGWEQFIHGSAPNFHEERAEHMLLDGLGNVYISGFLDDPASGNPYDLAPGVVKLALTDGAEIWRQTNAWTTGMFGHMVLDSGNLVVAGVPRNPATGAMLGGGFPAVNFNPEANFASDGGTLIVTTQDPLTVSRIDGTTFTPIWTSVAIGSRPLGHGQVAIAADGSVIVAGATSTAMPFGIEWVVAKVDGTNGNVLWTQQFTGAGGAGHHLEGSGSSNGALAVAPDGTVFVGGTLFGTDGKEDFAVKRLNAVDGHEEWSVIRRGPIDNDAPDRYAEVLALTADGDVIAAGFDHGYTASPCGSGIAPVILRIDGTTGTIEWEQMFTALCSHGVGINDLVISGGSIYAVGNSYTPADGGLHIGFVTRLAESTGAVEWYREYPGDGVSTRLTRIAIADSTLVIAGMGDGGSATGMDFFVSRLGLDGNNLCGNGIIDGGETCDDGGVESCDGCTATCQTEAGGICGDGVILTSCGEQCDDGNLVGKDGCSTTCTEEAPDEALETTAAPNVPVSSDSEADGATLSDPIETALTSPNGGNVSIMEETDSKTTAPIGYTLLSQTIVISAPPATAGTPLQIVFRLDGSRIPPGSTLGDINVLRNNVAVADCTGAPGVADPDPCVSERSLNGDDAQLLVLTSQASLWYLAETAPSDVPVHIKQLKIKDDKAESDATKRALAIAIKDPQVRPVDLSCTGPGGGGATLSVNGYLSTNDISIPLPCSGWVATGKAPSLTGSKYVDKERLAGPCTKASIKAGRKGGTIKISCDGKSPGSPLAYDLTNDGEGPVFVELTFPTGRYCGASLSTVAPGESGDNKAGFKGKVNFDLEACP